MKVLSTEQSMSDRKNETVNSRGSECELCPTCWIISVGLLHAMLALQLKAGAAQLFMCGIVNKEQQRT